MNPFTLLVNFISNSLQALYQLGVQVGIANYGFAIIVFTIIIKLILFPLTAQQVRSMRKMQELGPKVQELQKKYKGNPQKAQQEIMTLYQKEGANPLSGCLPLLVQMPILYALFSALRVFFDPAKNPALVVAHAGFIWIPNLGHPDPYILPVIAGAATFLQQWISMPRTGGAADQTQRTMLYIMPIFMGWISRGFPAGLALYWAVYSLASAGEQFILRRSGGIKKEVAKAGEKP